MKNIFKMTENKNTMNYRKAFPVLAALTVSMILGACGNIKTLETERKEFNDLSKGKLSVLSEEESALVQSGISAETFFLSQGVQDEGASLAVGTTQSVVEESSVGTSACAYVESLGQELAEASEDSKKLGKTFQILNELKIIEIDGEPVVVGSHNIAKNPQVLYGLSGEKSGDGVGLIKKKIPALPQFREMMKAQTKAGLDAKLAAGEISQEQYDVLLPQKMAEIDGAPDEALIPKRNGAVMLGLGENLPGAVDGQPAPLAKSMLMAEFYKGSKLLNTPADLSEARVAELQPLTTEMPLFSSEVSLADDWRNVLRISVADSQRKGELESASEEACLFALTQRLTAQVLVQKGFFFAPKLSDKGLIDSAEFAQTTEGDYTHAHVPGYFAQILEPKFIKAQSDGFAALKELDPSEVDKVVLGELLKNSTPSNALTTEDFVDVFQAWSQLMAARKAVDLWAVPQSETSSKKRMRMMPELSQLATGVFSLMAPVFSVNHLNVDEATKAISFPRDDSSDNLLRAFETALLHRLTLATVLTDYSPVDQIVLGGLSEACAQDPKIIILKEGEAPVPHPCLNEADQTALQTRAKLGADKEGTVLKSFTDLSDGATLELLRRMQDGRIAPGTEDYAAGLRILELAAYVIRSPGLLNRSAELRAAQ